jgi:glycine cleavage system H lipoate-binding protein
MSTCAQYGKFDMIFLSKFHESLISMRHVDLKLLHDHLSKKDVIANIDSSKTNIEIIINAPVMYFLTESTH